MEMSKRRKWIIALVVTIILLIFITAFVLIYMYRDRIIIEAKHDSIDRQLAIAIVDDVSNDTISPKGSETNMLESSTFGYKDIEDRFLDNGGSDFTRADVVRNVTFAHQLIHMNNFAFGRVYGKGQSINGKEVWSSVSYTQSTVVISISIVTKNSQGNIESFVDQKSIIYYDLNSHEYILTNLTKDVIGATKSVETYYRRSGGSIYFLAQGTLDSGKYVYDFNGINKINNKGLSIKYAEEDEEFRNNCDTFFDIEITKLGNLNETLSSATDVGAYNSTIRDYISSNLI